MINHISIGVRDTENVAKVLAELWNGIALPFPPAPDSFIVLANDGRGSAIEVTPINVVLEPGVGLPPEENFSQATLTEDYEAKFVASGFAPQYISTHININTRLSEAEVKAIGVREGWRTVTCNRDKGFFQLIELWLEDRLMIEVMTPEMTARYLEITDPAFLAQAFGLEIPPKTESPMILNLVG